MKPQISAIISAFLLFVLFLLCLTGCGRNEESVSFPLPETMLSDTTDITATDEETISSESDTTQPTRAVTETETHTTTKTTETQTESDTTTETKPETTTTAVTATTSETKQTTTRATTSLSETTSTTTTLPEPTLSESDLSEAAAEAITKLMIVAHPDDETIWGGAHLLEGGYLVLCITNGDNEVRSAEFQEAVRQTGNIPLMLHYPDKTDGERDPWTSCLENIRADIRFVLSAKQWSLVVTHNRRGEYGHIHHLLVSRLTTQEFEKSVCADRLNFFEAYHSPAELEETPEAFLPLSDDLLQEKQALCGIYASQRQSIRSLAHMLPYENWTEYSRES